MISQSKSSGFTLVELLVVVTISMVAIGLVGGLTVDAYAKYNAKAELLEVERIILQASVFSFIANGRVTVELNDNEIDVVFDGKKMTSKTFEYLRFGETEVPFNRMGIAQSATVDVSVQGSIKQIDLNDVLQF